MPTYQYACTACSEQLEAVQAFSDAPLTECPTCSGRLRKVYSAVGVVFKGSGFYRNDSRGKSSSESGGESKPEKKADAPVAAKSDTTSSTSASSTTPSGSTSTPAAKTA